MLLMTDSIVHFTGPSERGTEFSIQGCLHPPLRQGWSCIDEVFSNDRRLTSTTALPSIAAVDTSSAPSGSEFNSKRISAIPSSNAADIFDVVTDLSCLLGGESICANACLSLKVEMLFSRRLAYVPPQFFPPRTPHPASTLCRSGFFIMHSPVDV
jgi:hypothetical protein